MGKEHLYLSMHSTHVYYRILCRFVKLNICDSFFDRQAFWNGLPFLFRISFANCQMTGYML